MHEQEPDAGGVFGVSTPRGRHAMPGGRSAIDRVKSILPDLVGMVPGFGTVAGFVLRQFLEELFPGDAWGEIRRNVEEFVKEQIAKERYNELRAKLAGIETVAQDYSDLAQIDQDPAVILTAWQGTEQQLAVAIEQSNPTAGSDDLVRVLLLPLFVQVANLHLTVLRDMALHGHRWGAAPSTLDKFKKKLAGVAAPDGKHSYAQRAQTTFFKGCEATGSNVELAAFERGMVLNGYAQHTAWEYFDVVKYPTGHHVDLDWTVYLGPYGTLARADVPRAGLRPAATAVRNLTVYNSSGDFPINRSGVGGASWQPWDGEPVGSVLKIGKTETGPARPVETGDRSITRVWGRGLGGDKNFGVYALAFGVGTSPGDDTKVPPGWIGRTDMGSAEQVVDFSAPGYFLSDIQGGKYREWHLNMYNSIEWMAFGFRPAPTPYGPSDEPVAGRRYLLRSVRDGRYLVPKTLAQGSHIGLTRDLDSAAAVWWLDDAGRLKNAATGAYMRVKPPSTTVTADVPGTPFAFTRQNDGTYVGSRGGGFLKTDVDTLVDAPTFDPKDPGMRWSFESFIIPLRRSDGTRPSLALRTRRRDVGYFETAVTVSNPARGRTVPANWRLSFVLPPGLGGPVNATGHPVTPEVVSAKPHDRGLRVELRAAPWSARKTIEPGESFTFTLTGGAATGTTDIRNIHIWTDIPRIDGVPIDNTTHPGHDTHPKP